MPCRPPGANRECPGVRGVWAGKTGEPGASSAAAFADAGTGGAGDATLES